MMIIRIIILLFISTFSQGQMVIGSPISTNVIQRNIVDLTEWNAASSDELVIVDCDELENIVSQIVNNTTLGDTITGTEIQLGADRTIHSDVHDTPSGNYMYGLVIKVDVLPIHQPMSGMKLKTSTSGNPDTGYSDYDTFPDFSPSNDRVCSVIKDATKSTATTQYALFYPDDADAFVMDDNGSGDAIRYANGDANTMTSGLVYERTTALLFYTSIKQW